MSTTSYPASPRPLPHLAGPSLNKYVVHAYYSPFFKDQLIWNVHGKMVEAVVSPPRDLHTTSVFLTAPDLGLKESVLVEMRAWLRHWMFHNGREDPRAEHHSPSYVEAKRRVEELSGLIDPAVKKYFAEMKAV